MATNTRNNVQQMVNWYGAGEFFILTQTLVAGGAGNPPTVPPISDPANPPCAIEITTANIAFVADGKYTVTLTDSYFAVAFADAEVDDTADDGSYGTIGGWTNLQTSTPGQFTLFTRNAGGAKTAMAAGRLIRVFIVFKKDPTGAVA